MWKRFTDEINYDGINLYIKYSFKEGDDQVAYYPDGSGYPGSADEIEIDEIYVGNTDIIGIIEHDIIKELEEKMYKNHEQWEQKK